MRWFFLLGDDAVIELRARAEGDGVVGDAIREVEAGEEFFGVSYEDMADAEGGEIEVNERGLGRIIKS